MKTIDLNGTWSLWGKPQGSSEDPITLSGSVPGCVLLDLSAQGILPEDLYFGENLRQAEKYEEFEWWYERTFLAPEERERVFLVFEGVDCIAEYRLNGEIIGRSDNMFISHEFEIGDRLREGKNTLTVHLFSATRAAAQANHTVAQMHSWGDAGETQIRRAPHSFGWDIMPRAVTTGLWRGVRLEVRDEITFSQLFFEYDGRSAWVCYELNGDPDALRDTELSFCGSCGEDSTFTRNTGANGRAAGRVRLPIQNPKLWWPYGYGDPNIYDVTATILYHGTPVHSAVSSFGLRTVTLERTDLTDGFNGAFRFLINGVEILCKGSNWVPLDAFHCRDAERYEQALALVKDVGCNILRCWGGNVYEDHAFFDFCDRNGVMVWQDFAMACRIYPQTEDFQGRLRREATAVVRKLRNHASIILWSGDNEVDQVYHSFTDPAQNLLTRQILPQVVAENDARRPYLPSSPYISSEAHLAKNKALALSEDHLWGPRDYYKSDFYKQNKAHFVSETGYHGCPSPESIRKFISPQRCWPYRNNSEWIFHSSDQNGDDGRVMLMEKQVRQLFGTVPEDPETYALASQISQAEAKKYFIERIRVGRPYKTGIIWWNLLDGWPQMSDAVVDYYFTKKLAYSYIKRAQAPFSVVADEPSHWGIRLFACNDTLTDRQGTLTVKDAHTEQILYEGAFVAPKNASTPIASLPLFYSEHKILILAWKTREETGWNHYLCGFPPLSLEWYRSFLEKYNS
ncbi:MAG: hypothetical protein IIW31_03375 [Clostridia bacterium]|nr:hypothetical protein [Clostridia bacterium]